MLKKYSMRVRMPDSAPFQGDTAFVKDSGHANVGVRVPAGVSVKTRCVATLSLRCSDLGTAFHCF
jgi:hypothetical protein